MLHCEGNCGLIMQVKATHTPNTYFCAAHIALKSAENIENALSALYQLFFATAFEEA